MNENKVEEQIEKKGFAEKAIDFIFSNDERKWLLLITFFGFLLRLVNVNNRMMYGDPPHFVANAINFLNSGLLVTWDQSTFLWHALTDIFYNIFGITQFASRFSSLLFGTFTIILIYLFTKEFFGNKRIALISSTLYAFAPTFIFNAADEHDISVLFFIILSFYCLIRYLKRNQKAYLIYSSIAFGIACMWKAYVPILMVPYIGLILYHIYQKKLDIKKNWKIILVALAIIALLCSPVLVYNYLNYAHNDVPTFFFIKFFRQLHNEKTEELYGWLQELKENFSFMDLANIFVNGIYSSVYINGPILWIIFLLSAAWIIHKKEQPPRDYLVFFLMYFIVPYFLLIKSNNLAKHYIQFLAMAIPLISWFISSLYNSLAAKSKLIKAISSRHVLIFVLILLAEFFIVTSMPFGDNKEALYSPNPENSLINFKISSIPENSLVIYDDRIYNSLAGWMFNGRPYLSVNSLDSFMEYNKNMTNKQNLPVFMVECVKDDCGWGTVSQNQQLNESMEKFFSYIKGENVSKVFSSDKQFFGGYYNPLLSGFPKREENYAVYESKMNLSPALIKILDKQYSYFFYPLEYENKDDAVFKNFVYSPEGFFEESLNSEAWSVFYLEIFLSFAAIVFVIIEIYKSK